MSKKRKHNIADPIAPLAQPEVSSSTPSAADQAAAAALRSAEKFDASPERLGDILRSQREKRGEDLLHIAEYLRIKPDFLVALENSQYDLFPADAYVIGFLRSYAVHLGLDGKEAIDRYRHEMAGRRRKPTLLMPVPVAEGRAPSMLVIVGAVIGLILIYGVWYGVSSSNRTVVTQAASLPTTAIVTTDVTPPVVAQSAGAPPPVVAATAAVPVPAAVPVAVTPSSSASSAATTAPMALTAAAPTPAPAPVDAAAVAAAPAPAANNPAAGTGIAIYAVQPSWIMVNDGNGKSVFDRVLKAGETYKVPSGKGYTLTTGNIGGISLSVDGISLPRLTSPHDGGRVVRGIALDPDHLRTGMTDLGE